MSKRVTFAIAAAVSLALALAFTMPYGAFNQTTYLLDPLHRAMPELFARDWFVHTPSYMPVFGWLAHWLYRLDPEGPIAFLTAHVVIMLASYAALYWLVSTVSRDLRVFLIIAAFATATRVASLGGSYLFAGYLQPSSLATLGWLCAMAALVRRRYLACGVALAAAGAVHLNFLLLGIGLFTLVALAVRDATRWDYAKLLVPQLVVLACFVPVLLGASGASAEAVRILSEFHAAQHYAPERLIRWLPDVIAWQIAAYAALRLTEPMRELRVLWWFSLIATVVVCSTTLAMQLPALRWLTQPFWARMAPFGQLVCLLIVIVALLRPASRRIGVAAVMLAASIIAALYVRPSVIAFVVGAVLVALTFVPQAARYARTALAVAAVAGALWFGPRGSGLSTEPYANPPEKQLMSWVREHTPQDALFLIPPKLGRFRLHARRSVVADIKSPPLRPDLLVAWYQRLCAMVALPRATTTQDITDRYAKLTRAELVAIARAFEADYIVVEGRLPAPAEFENGMYAVYRFDALTTP